MLLVPTDAPGFSWTPVRTMAGVTTSATFYQDVRVPVTNLVGEENKGWNLITNQLNHERVALCSAANVQHARQRRAPLGPRDRRWPTVAG